MQRVARWAGFLFGGFRWWHWLAAVGVALTWIWAYAVLLYTGRWWLEDSLGWLLLVVQDVGAGEWGAWWIAWLWPIWTVFVVLSIKWARWLFGGRWWVAWCVAMVPQFWLVGWFYGFLPELDWRPGLGVEPVRERTAWLVCESCDAGWSFPRLEALAERTGGVPLWVDHEAVEAGTIGGLSAQWCGDRVRVRSVSEECLLDEGWRVYFGQGGYVSTTLRLSAGGADVWGRDRLEAEYGEMAEGHYGLHDSELLARARASGGRRVAVLLGGTHYPFTDFAVMQADGLLTQEVEWRLARGWQVVVLADHPRPIGGEDRLMGYVWSASGAEGLEGLRLVPYDVGCTLWPVLGGGCDRIGVGVDRARFASRVAGDFRMVR